MTYNLTFMETANNAFDVFKGIDTIIPGLFSGLLLFALFMVIIGSSKDRNLNNTILFASFVTSIVASLLFALGTIGTVHLIVPIVILIGAIIGKIFIGD
jgi:hypothetical protein